VLEVDDVKKRLLVETRDDAEASPAAHPQKHIKGGIMKRALVNRSKVMLVARRRGRYGFKHQVLADGKKCAPAANAETTMDQ